MMQDLETTSCKPEDLHVQSSLCISDKAGVHVLASTVCTAAVLDDARRKGEIGGNIWRNPAEYEDD